MKRILMILVGVLAGVICRADANEMGVRRLSVEDWRDKVKAGWLGQMIGVQWGLPTEFRYQGTPIPDEKVPAWTPGMLNGGFDNDDLFVEMTFLRTLERYGLDVAPKQAGIDYANAMFALCAANWAGRDNLRRGIAPPDCGHPRYNACADNIDYQIESDYAGLISPGLPQRTIELSRLFGTLVNSGDGVWAGAFMGGMYAEAFFSRDIGGIIDAGLACVPNGWVYACSASYSRKTPKLAMMCGGKGDGMVKRSPEAAHLAFDAHTPGLVVAGLPDYSVAVSRDGGAHFAPLRGSHRVPSGCSAKVLVDRGRLFWLTTGSGVWTRTLPTL